MENCRRDVGYHTVVYSEKVLGGLLKIEKQIRKCDGFVSWLVRETETDKGVTFDGCMVIYEAKDETEKIDVDALNKIKKALYEYMSKKTGCTIEQLMSL